MNINNKKIIFNLIKTNLGLFLIVNWYQKR